MSEQTDVDVIQRMYAAVGGGDIPTVLDLLADDVEALLVVTTSVVTLVPP